MAFSVSRSVVVLGVLAGGVSLTIIGCSTAEKSAGTMPAATQTAWWQPAPDDRSGAELWAQTCSRCHNLRSPASFGPRQWDVALYDMRVRANLTGEEQRKVLQFLKAASQ